MKRSKKKPVSFTNHISVDNPVKREESSKLKSETLTLLIRNLPSTIDHEMLRDLIPKRTHIELYKKGKKRHAFVKFAKDSHCMHALEKLNHTQLEGKELCAHLVMRKAKPASSSESVATDSLVLTISNIPFNVTQLRLEEEFPTAHKIHMNIDPSGRFRGSCLLTFESEDDLRIVQEACHNRKIDGRSLTCNLGARFEIKQEDPSFGVVKLTQLPVQVDESMLRHVQPDNVPSKVSLVDGTSGDSKTALLWYNTAVSQQNALHWFNRQVVFGKRLCASIWKPRSRKGKPRHIASLSLDSSDCQKSTKNKRKKAHVLQIESPSIGIDRATQYSSEQRTKMYKKPHIAQSGPHFMEVPSTTPNAPVDQLEAKRAKHSKVIRLDASSEKDANVELHTQKRNERQPGQTVPDFPVHTPTPSNITAVKLEPKHTKHSKVIRLDTDSKRDDNVESGVNKRKEQHGGQVVQEFHKPTATPPTTPAAQLEPKRSKHSKAIRLDAESERVDNIESGVNKRKEQHGGRVVQDFHEPTATPPNTPASASQLKHTKRSNSMSFDVDLDKDTTIELQTQCGRTKRVHSSLIDVDLDNDVHTDRHTWFRKKEKLAGPEFSKILNAANLDLSRHNALKCE